MLETLSYAYKITLSLIQNRKFRNAILKLLVKLYSSSSNPDYINVIQVSSVVLESSFYFIIIVI